MNTRKTHLVRKRKKEGVRLEGDGASRRQRNNYRKTKGRLRALRQKGKEKKKEARLSINPESIIDKRYLRRS